MAAPAAGATPARASTLTAQASTVSGPSAAAADTTAADKAHSDRCAQLMAQGQTALAQAEDCGGGDTPIFAGSIVSVGQTVAPASRMLPDADNNFAALNVYVAPRLRLTDKWGLTADTSLGYEQTLPDDTTHRHQAVWSDPRVTVTGNLGSVGGFTFAGGPRLIIPLSAASRTSNAFLGAGLTMNIVRAFDVLDGLALVAGGGYSHTFAGNVTRTDPDVKNQCDLVTGTRVSCPLSGAAIVQDGLRAVGMASLNLNTAVSLQASYLYSWNFLTKLSDLPTQLPGVVSDNSPVLEGDETGHDITRWRSFGSLSLSVNYQPTDWVIASLQGNTSVCYNADSGGQSSLGGCAGGNKVSDFSLRNPLVNKFSTLSLQFTIPIDAVYSRIKNRLGEEKKTAAARAATRL